MENTLLLGNGLNLCLDGGVAWGQLLSEMASKYGIEPNLDIPLPLEFERIINKYLSNTIIGVDVASGVYTEEKQRIADRIKTLTLPKSAIHYCIKDLPIASIITTNYDLNLERVYDESFKPRPIEATKYINSETDVVSKIAFFACLNLQLFTKKQLDAILP